MLLASYNAEVVMTLSWPQCYAGPGGAKVDELSSVGDASNVEQSVIGGVKRVLVRCHDNSRVMVTLIAGTPCCKLGDGALVTIVVGHCETLVFLPRQLQLPQRGGCSYCP